MAMSDKFSFSKRPKTVGLFGLSANPPHYGHIKMAQYVHNILGLDEIWWIVAAQNPLKPAEGMAPFEDRLKMCRIISAPYPWLKVTDIEQRCGTQRTYDTLTLLKSMNRNIDFTWIMGADNLAGFHKWYKWRDIADMLPIAVLARPGETEQARMSRAGIEMHKFENAEEMKHQPSGYVILDNPMVEISSTSLRQNPQARLAGTSPAVNSHIRSQQLYGF